MAMSRHTLPIGEHSAAPRSGQSLASAVGRLSSDSGRSGVEPPGSDPVPAHGFTALPSAVEACQSRSDENIVINEQPSIAQPQSAGSARAVRPASIAQGSIAVRYGGLGLRHGFVPLPVSLHRNRRPLGLTASLLDLITVLLSCGGGREYPHPSIAWLGVQLGVDERTVQRRIGRLIDLGHLVVFPRRTVAGRQGANAYDLQPLLAQAETLDAQETSARECRWGGVAAASPIVERRDLDPMEVPPTPTAEPAGRVLSRETPPTRGTPAGERSTCFPKQVTVPWPTPEQVSDDPGPAARLALAPVLAPILDRYQDPAPAAALGQFAGLQQRYHLAPQAFALALAEAVRQLEERLEAVQQAVLGHVRRPVAYLYAVLAQLLAERAAPVPIPPQAEPTAAARVRTAVTRLAAELGAPQPISCGNQAVKLYRQSSMAPAAFWSLLREAACQTRRCTIRTTKNDGTPNAMPLFFTILKRLLDAPAGPTTSHGPMRQTQSREHERAGRAPAPAPPIIEDHSIWRGVLEELRVIMTPTNFLRCLATRVVGQSGDLLQVAVPSGLEMYWFDTHIRRRVEEAVAARGHAGIRVQFVVAPAVPGPASTSQIEEGFPAMAIR